ncbi:MAG: LysM peptidoglycan-binding domain-containing protein, partial [Planctomycetota bacterium]
MNRDAKIGVVVILIIVGLVVIIWGTNKPGPEDAEITAEDASTPPAESLEPDFGFEDAPFRETEEIEPARTEQATETTGNQATEGGAEPGETENETEAEEESVDVTSGRTTEPSRNQVWVYTVKSGDTLSEIAERELGRTARYPEVAELNHLAKPYRIRAGQKLKMPPRGTTSSSDTSVETPAKKGTPTVVGKKKYVVRQRDIKDVM